MEFLNNIFTNETIKPVIVKDQLNKESKIIYITSIEEWEHFYINMYDFQLVLKKNNPKFNELAKLIKIYKIYSISFINNDEEYIIIDIEEKDHVKYNTTIKSITNDINMNTIIKTNPLSTGVILARDNKAYCGLYNELKLNIPCCLILCGKNQLIGVSETEIISKQIKIKGLINIGIEYNHLNDYQEIVTMDKDVKNRIVFQKHSFEFKVGHNYIIKLQKTQEDYLHKIIESDEI
jgi:hypothetical protein